MTQTLAVAVALVDHGLSRCRWTTATPRGHGRGMAGLLAEVSASHRGGSGSKTSASRTMTCRRATNPTDPGRMNGLDPSDRPARPLDLVDDLRLDPVEQPSEHVADSPDQRPDDHQQQRAGPPAAGSASGQPAQAPAIPASGRPGWPAHRSAVVRPISLQRAPSCPPPDPELLLGHRLVAARPDEEAPRSAQPGLPGGAGAPVSLAKRLGRGVHRRGSNGQHHQHPGDVRGPGGPEGVAAVGLAPADQRRRPTR